LSCFHFFRDDHGRSLPERGIDQLRIGERRKTFARFLAIAGMCQLSILLTYNIPYQLYALHSQMSPVYLQQPWRLGEVCGPDTNYDCPGPGVPIPRHDSPTNRTVSPPAR
jgi:Spirocyclase AveC-like